MANKTSAKITRRKRRKRRHAKPLIIEMTNTQTTRSKFWNDE
jgi:hypothetical protein